MADNSDNSDFSNLLQQIGQYGINYAGGQQANAITQAAYKAMLDNLQQRMGDYQGLGPAGYKSIQAQQLGKSALDNIPQNAQAQMDQQAAIAQLQDIANKGGLNLADRAALNNVESTLSRNNAARQQSLANQFAARGQLGSGAQLAMELNNNQNAAQNANQHGEDIAGQAEQRAMQAIIQKGQAARTMQNDQYARDKAAADAQDAIARYNANTRTDASKYNNTILGQNLEDQLKKFAGENAVTGNMNQVILGGANSQANTVKGNAALGSSLLGNLGNSFRSSNGSGNKNNNGSGNNSGDTPDAPGTQGTSDFNANLQPDPTGDGSGLSSGSGSVDSSFYNDNEGW